MEFLKEKAAKFLVSATFVIVATFLLLSKNRRSPMRSLSFCSHGSSIWPVPRGISYSTGSTNPGRSLCRRPLSIARGVSRACGSCSESARSPGFYKKSKQLFEKSEDWEKHVNSPLQASKAARTLIIPCILILIWRGSRLAFIRTGKYSRHTRRQD